MFSKEVKEVCQDVINRVRSGSLVPNRGSVLCGDTEKIFANMVSNKSCKETINNNVCKVCAKGSIFLSWVGTNNKYTTKQVLDFNYDLEYEGSCPIEIKNIFGKKLLNAIEIAFELEVFSWSYNSKSPIGEYERLEELRKFYVKEYSEDEKERLLEIMQDIIDDRFVTDVPA